MVAKYARVETELDSSCRGITSSTATVHTWRHKVAYILEHYTLMELELNEFARFIGHTKQFLSDLTLRRQSRELPLQQKHKYSRLHTEPQKNKKPTNQKIEHVSCNSKLPILKENKSQRQLQ
jgi:hypothetical protein